MSYPGTPQDHTHASEGAIVTLGNPGVIIMGLHGLQVNTLGTQGVSLGVTTGANAVNPSGTQGGVKLPSQNNFRRSKRR